MPQCFLHSLYSEEVLSKFALCKILCAGTAEVLPSGAHC